MAKSKRCKSYPCRFPCSCKYFKESGFEACLTYDFAEVKCGDACKYAAHHYGVQGTYFYCERKGMSAGRLKRRPPNCQDAIFHERLFELRKSFDAK